MMGAYSGSVVRSKSVGQGKPNGALDANRGQTGPKQANATVPL